MIPRTAIVLLALLVTFPLYATDHWDGPSVKDHPSADITDFFAFPIPGRRMVLMMMANPAATAATRFDDMVTYKMRLRRITKIDQTPLRFLPATTETAIVCKSRLEAGKEQTIRCAVEHAGSEGAEARAEISTTVSFNQSDGGNEPQIRLFAGARADTSFTDVARARMPVWRDQGFADKPGVNTLAGKSVLALIVDLDLDAVLGREPDGPLYAAVGQTSVLHHDAVGNPILQQIDRMGRLEVTVFLILDDHLRDVWNHTDSFNPDPAALKVLRPALQAGMHRMDDFEKSLIGQNVIDWPVPHPLLEVFLDDYLVVDVSKPISPSSTASGYLEIEQSTLAGLEPATCGGRRPNEDVIARMLTLLINGPVRPHPDRGVGVTMPARPAKDPWPYAQPPFW